MEMNNTFNDRSAMVQKPVISARKLGFSYTKSHATVLDNINVDLSVKSRLALLGANGSGKSTLLNLLAGALEPSAGAVRLDGEPYRYTRRGRNKVRTNVQLVTQDPDEQIFAATVAADVSYGPANMGLSVDEIHERVDEALALAEIENLAEKVAHQLSYGQRKRVALAGALAMRPRVLLLDEPSAGLDPHATARLLATLDKFIARGTAIMVATHDLDFAWAFAEEAAVLVNGSLTVGRKEEVMVNHELLSSARLSVPWAPLVSTLVGHEVSRPEDLL